MNRALPFIILTIVLLLTSFSTHSQSENDLPSCGDYEYTAPELEVMNNFSDTFATIAEIMSDTSDVQRWAERAREWAVFTHTDWLSAQNMIAQCLEFTQLNDVFLDVIYGMYALTSQYTVFLVLSETERPTLVDTITFLTTDLIEKTTTLGELATQIAGQGINSSTNILPSNEGLLDPTELASPVESQWICTGDIYNCPDFSTCAEARDYFTTCPGDPSNLDRDGDGTPCNSLCGG